MKKALVLALCVVGFIPIAAPGAVEYAPLFVNGKRGRAVFVNGIVAISVENAATDVGSKSLSSRFFSTGPRSRVVGSSEWKWKEDATGLNRPRALRRVPPRRPQQSTQAVGQENGIFHSCAGQMLACSGRARSLEVSSSR